MARIRSIHPQACDGERIAAVSDSAERTFWRLNTHADDEGRGEDNPTLLASKLYPLRPDKTPELINADLAELAEHGLLTRYTVNGRNYYQIAQFTDWQKPRHPSPSKLPPPITAVRGNDAAERRTPLPSGGSPHAGVEGRGVEVGVEKEKNSPLTPRGGNRRAPRGKFEQALQQLRQLNARHGPTDRPTILDPVLAETIAVFGWARYCRLERKDKAGWAELKTVFADAYWRVQQREMPAGNDVA